MAKLVDTPGFPDTLEKWYCTSYTVYGNINWYSHYGEQYGGSLKN